MPWSRLLMWMFYDLILKIINYLYQKLYIYEKFKKGFGKFPIKRSKIQIGDGKCWEKIRQLRTVDGWKILGLGEKIRWDGEHWISEWF